jgi:uncharacterized phage-associated protein
MNDLLQTAVAVANDFLRRARESFSTLSATQIHELVYCAHGWHLVTAGTPLISGPVAAHRGGVYVPDLRIAGCWGGGPVQGLLHAIGDEHRFPRVDVGTPAFSTIERVWSDYGPLTRFDLTRFTLAENGPWDQVWSSGDTQDSLLIPNRLLREWFGQVATWRSAVDRVSTTIDRAFDQPAVIVDRAVDARPAENDAIALDRVRLREFRSHRLSQH